MSLAAIGEREPEKVSHGPARHSGRGTRSRSVGRAPSSAQCPPCKHRDVGGQVPRLGQVVADQHERAPARELRREQRAEPVGGRGVETGERLVEQEDVGLVQQRAGDGGALQEAAAQVAHRCVGARAQADLVERHPGGRGGVGQAVEPGRKVQILRAA